MVAAQASRKKTEDETVVKEVEESGQIASYFDINQLELAIINRALRGMKQEKIPDFVEIGKKERILRIQKRNLEALLRKKGKETREGVLDAELGRILSGVKIFSLLARR